METPAMKLQMLPSEGDVLHLGCEGELTLATLPANANPVADTLGPGCFARKVLFNLEKATYLDTVGVGCLVTNHKHFQDEGGKFVLHSLPPEAVHLLRLLRLDKILHLAVDETAARELARRGAVDHA